MTALYGKSKFALDLGEAPLVQWDLLYTGKWLIYQSNSYKDLSI